MDLRIRRAAGVILWHLNKGHTLPAAVAKASAREPELTEDELSTAADWANAALAFRGLAYQATGRMEQYVDEATGRIRYRMKEGAQPISVADLIDAAGLTPFKHKRNG